VLHVIYLVFNEGYLGNERRFLDACNLSGEAIRLGRLLVELLPEPEAMGLLALMLLHKQACFANDTGGRDDLAEDQDRSLWDQAQIAEGVELVESALASIDLGRTHFRPRSLPYTPRPRAPLR